MRRANRDIVVESGSVPGRTATARGLAFLAVCCATVIARSGDASLDDAARNFAAAKYAYLRTNDTMSDPLTPGPASTWKTTPVTLGAVCGVALDPDFSARLVEILPTTHFAIREVVGFDKRGKPFSLVENDGLSRIGRKLVDHCHIEDVVRPLADLYLRLLRMPTDETWRVEKICAEAPSDQAGAECRVPAVHKTSRSVTFDAWVYWRTPQSLGEWESWQFSLDRTGRFDALRREKDVSNGRHDSESAAFRAR